MQSGVANEKSQVVGQPETGLQPPLCTSHFPLGTERWALQDSNLGRAGYEPAALTTELRAPKKCQVRSAKCQVECKVTSGKWWLPRGG